MSDDNLISTDLTQREVKLLLRYSYPFEDVAAQLEAFKDRRGTHCLKVHPYYLPKLIGDLVYSAKKVEDERLLAELDELCTVLEMAEGRAVRVGCRR